MLENKKMIEIILIKHLLKQNKKIPKRKETGKKCRKTTISKVSFFFFFWSKEKRQKNDSPQCVLYASTINYSYFISN